jgi:hypothetical protein
MTNRVIITDEDSYGSVEKSPTFKPEIKVIFATDIPVIQRKEIQKEIENIKSFMNKDKDNMSEEESKQYKEQSLKYGEMMIKIIVLDWNLYDKEGNKLPINADTLDNKLSSLLSNWIMETAMSFFTTPGKTI